RHPPPGGRDRVGQPGQGRRRAGGSEYEHLPRARRNRWTRGLLRDLAVNEAIVIKVGGDLAAKPEQSAALAADLRALLDHGHAVVVVHGGRPQTTAVTRQLGLEPNIVAGRRITDRPTLDVVKMVLGGLVNVDLTALLTANGVPCVGISGVSSHLIDAVKRPPRVVSGGGDEPIDFGWVGDIVGINAELLRHLQVAGYVPVMNSIGADRD